MSIEGRGGLIRNPRVATEAATIDRAPRYKVKVFLLYMAWALTSIRLVE